jgi:hypothetical protein
VTVIESVADAVNEHDPELAVPLQLPDGPVTDTVPPGVPPPEETVQDTVKLVPAPSSTMLLIVVVVAACAMTRVSVAGEAEYCEFVSVATTA